MILNREVLKMALNILDSELNPDYILPDAKPEYRKRLAQSLFYKVISYYFLCIPIKICVIHNFIILVYS